MGSGSEDEDDEEKMGSTRSLLRVFWLTEMQAPHL